MLQSETNSLHACWEPWAHKPYNTNIDDQIDWRQQSCPMPIPILDFTSVRASRAAQYEVSASVLYVARKIQSVYTWR